MGKKILCLIDTLGMGGAEHQMIGLAKFLTKKGYDVCLATYINHNYDKELRNRFGLNCTKLSANQHSRLSKIKVVRDFIKANHFDAIIAYKDGPAVICSLLRLFGYKFRLIVSERNTDQKVTLHNRIKFFFYRWADYVVPNSYAQKRFVEDNFPSLAYKTVTITNYTDTDSFHPVIMNPNAKLVILTVARVTSQKNVKRFMNVIKRLMEKGVDVQFIWYGDAEISEPDYRKECLNMQKDMELQGILTFHNASTEIVKAYQQCDIFCLPSLYEGYPNVLCEAMCCGKPVLCSNVCDNSSIIENGINGYLFDPLDEEDMMEKMMMMISLPKEQRELMGKRSREIAEMKFSKESFISKYINLIESGH